MANENLADVQSDVFHDFAQDRYTVEVATRLVLALPITPFRPEAMRVTERCSGVDTWFEVETYCKSHHRWIEQKSHGTERLAVDDANGWYPEPSAT